MQPFANREIKSTVQGCAFRQICSPYIPLVWLNSGPPTTHTSEYLSETDRERDCRACGATQRKEEQGLTEYQVCFLGRGLQNFPAAPALTSPERTQGTACRHISFQLATDLAATMFLHKWLK